MERDRLILRLKPVSDQRKLYISLTPDGKLLYEKARLQVEEGYQAIEQAFSSEKMTQLTLLLDELIALGDLASVSEHDESPSRSLQMEK